MLSDVPCPLKKKRTKRNATTRGTGLSWHWSGFPVAARIGAVRSEALVECQRAEPIIQDGHKRMGYLFDEVSCGTQWKRPD